MFSRGALTVLRVRGVPIRLHFSVLLLIPFLTWALAAQTGLVAEAAGLPVEQLALPGWAWGLIASAGLLVSITLHELAHTLLAIRHGGRVDSIVLMALGGVSQITQMPRQPKHELVMAIAGPITSILLAVGFSLGYAATRATPNVAFALFVLAYLNLVLGIFNLLPAFPMDGGRVLRAALAWRWGKHRATRIAATVGKAMAVVFGLVGLLGGGVWLVLIAFFVWAGASQEKLHAEVQNALANLRVGEMKNTVPSVAVDASVEDARVLLRDAGATSGVVVEDGKTLGVIRRDEIYKVPVEERSREQVRDHMLRTVAVETNEEIAESFDRVLREGEVPVIDHDTGEALGVVRAADVLAKLQERGFHLPGEGPRSPPGREPPA